MEKKIIGQEKARKLAIEELKGSGNLKEHLFPSLAKISVGNPVMVKTVFGEPSYWTVPLLSTKHVVGFIRVLGEGQVATVGSFYQDHKKIANPLLVITGINPIEAMQKVSGRIHFENGESASEPMYVHDGPPGREAWRIEIYQDGRPVRWIFVTAAFVYERLAGELLDENLE